MDGQTLQAAAAIGVPSLATVIWLLRLEGRVNTNEALQTRTADDVKYIRERIDQVLDQR